MSPEAAPRNCARPGAKLGPNNGYPLGIAMQAISDREETAAILRSLKGPMRVMDHDYAHCPQTFIGGIDMSAAVHKFRANGNHYNGGALFYGYGYSAIGEPRLLMIRKTYKSGTLRGCTVSAYYVDGMVATDYEAAVERLKVPPIFTDAEIAALRLIGDTPADVRRVVRDAVGWSPLHYLGEKGAIKWEPPGSCARTDVGRAALAAADAKEEGESR